VLCDSRVDSQCTYNTDGNRLRPLPGSSNSKGRCFERILLVAMVVQAHRNLRDTNTEKIQSTGMNIVSHTRGSPRPTTQFFDPFPHFHPANFTHKNLSGSY